MAFSPRVMGMDVDMDKVVRESLERAALWEDVKDDLKADALSLALGQQQRLCIARVIAVQPEVILMDRSTSALDQNRHPPRGRVDRGVKTDYTIVIVTHNMQQAARVSDYTGLFWLGELVEFSETNSMFTKPKQS
ncbi:MAG: ATP-binding cassette domain-containing protein [Anaerolineales bacterium]